MIGFSIAGSQTAEIFRESRKIELTPGWKGAYNAGTTYSEGDIVKSGSEYYISREDSNANNTPSVNSRYWGRIFPQPVGGGGGATSYNALTDTDAIEANKKVVGNAAGDRLIATDSLLDNEKAEVKEIADKEIADGVLLALLSSLEI